MLLTNEAKKEIGSLVQGTGYDNCICLLLPSLFIVINIQNVTKNGTFGVYQSFG